jgi:hypothetical protein
MYLIIVFQIRQSSIDPSLCFSRHVGLAFYLVDGLDYIRYQHPSERLIVCLENYCFFEPLFVTGIFFVG